MRRYLRTIGVAVSAGAFVASAVGVSAQQPQDPPPEVTGITLSLTEVPEARQNDERALAYIIDHVRQGTEFSRSIEIANNTEEELTLSLYPVAASIIKGAFTTGDGRAENELTSWIRVDPPSVQLAPGASSPAKVTISVPADADDGERYGAVIAEAPGETGTGGVVVNRRVGIRVYLSVGQGSEPTTDFAIDSLTAKRDEDGTPIVTGEVENTGERAVDLRGDLVLSDGPGGVSAGPFPAELGTTLEPDAREAVRVVLDPELPEGPWLARLTLRSGSTERAAEATITFPSEPGESAPPVKADDVEEKRKILLPIALILLLIVAVLLYLLWRRRRADRKRSAGS